MEEDIKVLEEIIEINKKYGIDICINRDEIQAIENLIARNKELEEENIKYERANDYLQTLNHKYYEDNVTLLRKNGNVEILSDDIHFKYIDDVNNYIPKSKVREKIDELEKEIEEKQENCLDFTLMHEHEIDTNAIIKVLQELLEERN